MDDLLSSIEVKHPLVARKLRLASEQLSRATSIEEYQQIGILIRDAWIEFIQLLFSVELVPEGTKPPSPSDVSAMLEYVLKTWSNVPKTLRQLVNKLYDLSMEIQHDRGTSDLSPKWAISITLTSMAMMLELDAQHQKLADRLYYKCPTCGSLDIKVNKGTEYDHEGPVYEYENWECESCDWQHQFIR